MAISKARIKSANPEVVFDVFRQVERDTEEGRWATPKSAASEDPQRNNDTAQRLRGKGSVMVVTVVFRRNARLEVAAQKYRKEGCETVEHAVLPRNGMAGGTGQGVEKCGR
jgi:hypothetical protein